MPTSLLYNWEMEASKFTPDLKILTYTGTGRTIDLTFDIAAPGAPIPPSGIGSYTPNSGAPSTVTSAR